jgi:type II secretory ATPase GspE/PulE/Tfp pilus assembly ATPase PilB-like protein
MPITPELQSLLLAGTDVLRIAAHAQQSGVLSLREAGMIKAQEGITSHEEVWAATSV